MRTSPPAQLPIFRSDLQARILALLLGHGARELTVPELVDALTANRTGVYRELQRLVDAGIVERRRVGRNTLYRADEASPLVDPLRVLLERTLGIEPELRRLLGEVPGIHAAAIFGSFASGRLRGDSDVDLLVIGEPDRDALERAVRSVEAAAGRDVNVATYGIDDWRERVSASAGFAHTVLSRPMIPLIGEVPAA